MERETQKGKERAFSLESGEANKSSVSGGLSYELKDHPNRAQGWFPLGLAGENSVWRDYRKSLLDFKD